MVNPNNAGGTYIHDSYDKELFSKFAEPLYAAAKIYREKFLEIPPDLVDRTVVKHGAWYFRGPGLGYDRSEIGTHVITVDRNEQARFELVSEFSHRHVEEAMALGQVSNMFPTAISCAWALLRGEEIV